MRIQTVRIHYSAENFLVQVFNFILELVRFLDIVRFSDFQIVRFRIAHKIFWTDFRTIRGPPVM